jgi:hypothetical protein
MNRWLDTLTDDNRTFNPYWLDPHHSPRQLILDDLSKIRYEELMAQSSFFWSDVVYGHEIRRHQVPVDAFTFTMLRDPKKRIVSQILDWRSLVASDLSHESPSVRAWMEETKTLSMKAFLEKHALNAVKTPLDNYMTRVLAAGRVGRSPLDANRTTEYLNLAVDCLAQDFDVVGLSEMLLRTMNVVSAGIGLPPVRSVSSLNVRAKSSELAAEIEAASEILDELTSSDAVLYDWAVRLFHERHAEIADHYNHHEFEHGMATRLMAEQRYQYHNGCARNSVRQPIIGSGFHQRDAGGTEHCAVWTGPDRLSTLYISVPPDTSVELLIWINGYADSLVRDRMTISIDGQPLPYSLERDENCADLVVVPYSAKRNFIRLEIDTGQTFTLNSPSHQEKDLRPRGLNFSFYGWRPLIAPVAVPTHELAPGFGTTG